MERYLLGGTVINQYTYTYDGNGNIISEKRSGYGKTTTITLLDYDDNGRLTRWQVRNEGQSAVLPQTTFGLNAWGNHLLSYEEHPFRYDKDGNITERLLLHVLRF